MAGVVFARSLLKKKKLILMFGGFTLAAFSLLADPPPAATPIDLWQQTTLTGNWGGQRDKLHEDGADFYAQYTSEALGNPYGGNDGQGAIYEGLLETRVSLDLEKCTGGAWPGATFRISSYWTHGPSLTHQNVGDLSTISNIDAYDTLRLEDCWLQQNFCGDKISLEIGQIAVDSEFFISQDGLLFLNGTFGAFPAVTYDFQPYNPAIFPVTTTGFRLKLQPIDSFYFMTALYNGDAGSSSGSNKDGLHFGFSADKDLLSFSELGYLLHQGKGAQGLPGTYKLGAWVHTAHFSTWESQAAQANGTGPLQSAGVGYGIYGVADQTVWQNEDASLSLFFRVVGSPSKSSEFDFDCDGGLNGAGLIPGRNSDVLGLGLSRSFISHDFSHYSQATGGPAYRAESVLEGTYSFNVAPWWQVQPDVQYIFSAGATTTSPDALVLGLRSTVTF